MESPEFTPVPDTRVRIVEIPIRDLHIAHYSEGGYQRDLRPAQVRAMLKDWDVERMDPLVVSQRIGGSEAGKYFVVDGQHRLGTAKLLYPEWQTLSCQVRAMTFEEEAKLFAQQGENRVAVNFRDLFRAKERSGDPEVARLREAAEAFGVKIAVSGGAPTSRYVTPRVLTEIDKVFGELILRRTLSIASTAYPEDMPKRYDSRFLQGLAYFLRIFPQVRDKDLIERLSATHRGEIRATPEFVLKEGRMYGEGNNGRYISRAILDVYNYHRADYNRLAWDDSAIREVVGKTRLPRKKETE